MLTFKMLIIYLTAPGLGCGMWDQVRGPGIEAGASVLGVQSQPLDHQGSPAERPLLSPIYSAV